MSSIAVIFGASGGIGRALVQKCVSHPAYDKVFALSRTGTSIDGAYNMSADPSRETELADVVKTIATEGQISLCLVAIGLLSDGESLRPEKSFRQQTTQNFERAFQVNTIIPALIAKHVLPHMSRQEPAIFAALSARVGSISDNQLGGWHGYRASKAALNMLIKNYAIEMKLRNPNAVIVSLHPGTVDTPLSKPFQRSNPTSTLFKPSEAAHNLLAVTRKLTPKDTGQHFDWAGKTILP